MSTDETKIEAMPADVREILKSMGLDDAQTELVGLLGQKIKNFAIDNVTEGDMISPADLAIAGMACKMTGAWFDAVAMDLVDSE